MLVYDLPSFAKISKVRMRIVANTRGFESPFSRQSAYERMAGDRWTVEMEFTPMVTRADARQLRSFLSRLDGRSGCVALSDPAFHIPSGAIGTGSSWGFSDGTDFTEGTEFEDSALTASIYATASPGDDSIVLAGLPASLAQAIKPGDQFQAGSVYADISQLFEAQGEVSTDSSGRVRVPVRPRVRGTILAGTEVYFSRPKGKFRMTSDDVTGVEINPETSNLSAVFVEAIY
jgi:hypothetical protein